MSRKIAKLEAIEFAAMLRLASIEHETNAIHNSRKDAPNAKGSVWKLD